jgi:hypothetical protein
MRLARLLGHLRLVGSPGLSGLLRGDVMVGAVATPYSTKCRVRIASTAVPSGASKPIVMSAMPPVSRPSRRAWPYEPWPCTSRIVPE